MTPAPHPDDAHPFAPFLQPGEELLWVGRPNVEAYPVTQRRSNIRWLTVGTLLLTVMTVGCVLGDTTVPFHWFFGFFLFICAACLLHVLVNPLTMQAHDFPHYAVSNKRVLLHSYEYEDRLIATAFEQVRELVLVLGADNVGTLKFLCNRHMGDVVHFTDIDNARTVCQQIITAAGRNIPLQIKERTQPNAVPRVQSGTITQVHDKETRMKPVIRITLLLLIIGGAIGLYRNYQAHYGGKTTPGFSLPTFTTANNKTSPPDNGTAQTGTSTNPGDIQVLTTATKQGWLQEEIDAFNGQNGGKYHVTLKLVESREAMQGILNGKEQPTVWSPSSPVWIARLAEVWSAKHGGQQIADMGEPSVYRVFFKSPLVFVTTKDKADFLRPLLSSPKCWANVQTYSNRPAPWGRPLRWSHADPLNASSGMLTMALIVNEYAQTHGTDADENAMGTAKFASYLGSVEKNFVYDPATLGSSALEKAFTQNPSTRDFITAYESKALDAVNANPNLVVIYPNPTANADQSAAVLSAPWVSDKQAEGARAFLKFLSGSGPLRDGMTYHFRPAQPGAGLSLAAQLSDAAPRGFRQTYSAIELPPYGALNEAAAQWRTVVAHQSGP